MRVDTPTRDLIIELVKRKVITKRLVAQRGNKQTFELNGLVTMTEGTELITRTEVSE